MVALVITYADIAPLAPTLTQAQADIMIADAIARAGTIAPCLKTSTLTQDQADAAKAVIRSAVLRWHDAGSGAVQNMQVGPFGQTIDTRQVRKSMFFPSEITELQRICRGDNGKSELFMVDTAPVDAAPKRPLNWWELNI